MNNQRDSWKSLKAKSSITDCYKAFIVHPRGFEPLTF
jgi:hypothetical protein